MKEKTRSPFIAITINKIFRFYWFFTRPKTNGVKALIFNKGKILMVRLTYYPKTWTFPGGGIDKNESPEEAVIRECQEEVGIRLKDPKFLKTLDFDYEYKKDTIFIYREEVETSDFKIDKKEVAEAGWFDLNNLPNIGENAIRMIGALKEV